MSFNSAAISLTLERSLEQGISLDEIRSFGNQAEFLTEVVIDQLSLDEFSRISTKMSFAYPADDKDEAERWLLTLGAFEISGHFSSAFGGSVEVATASFTVVGDDRKYRVQFGIAEKQAQIDRASIPITIRTSTLSERQDKAFKERLRDKRKGVSGPTFASMIEIDAYQENPLPFNINDYVKSSLENAMRNLEHAVTPPK